MGSLDACAGFCGLLFGAGLYAEIVYPGTRLWIHKKGGVEAGTLQEFLCMNRAPVIVLLVALMVGFFWLLETRGL